MANCCGEHLIDVVCNLCSMHHRQVLTFALVAGSFKKIGTTNLAGLGACCLLAGAKMLQQHTLLVGKQCSHFRLLLRLSLLVSLLQCMYHQILSSCNMHE